MPKTRFWIIGKTVDVQHDPPCWEFQGIVAEEHQAILACRSDK